MNLDIELFESNRESTPADAGAQSSTIQHVSLVRRIQSKPEWTFADLLHHKLLELQNRWSASLAMSTDGSFPSRPRQFRTWPAVFGAAFVTFRSRPT
jgi:hypothetical protein